MTYADWDELKAKLPLQPWQGGLRLTPHFKPWKPARRDIPDFLVDPKKSIVLELKCAEINESTEFSSGYTLRFPRVEAIRYDKPWSQCLTVTELKEIYENPVRKPTAEARLAYTPSSSTTVQVPALPMSPSLFPPSATPASFPRQKGAPARPHRRHVSDRGSKHCARGTEPVARHRGVRYWGFRALDAVVRRRVGLGGQ